MRESTGVLLSQDSEVICSPPTSVLARQEFHRLERWLYSEDTGGLSLREVEMGEEVRGRELLRLLLQAHVECRGVGDVGLAIEVFDGDGSAEGLRYTHKRTHVRQLYTIFGLISIRRVGYGMPGKASLHPLDEALQLPARMFSYELQRRLVKKIVQGPFDEAIEAVRESTGVGVPKLIAEKMLIEASVDFDRFYAQRQGNGGLQTGPIIVGSVDCKGIPMVKSQAAQKTVRRGKGQKANKKKMATVATVFTVRPRIRTPEEVVESLFCTKKKRDKKGAVRRPGPRESECGPACWRAKRP